LESRVKWVKSYKLINRSTSDPYIALQNMYTQIDEGMFAIIYLTTATYTYYLFGNYEDRYGAWIVFSYTADLELYRLWDNSFDRFALKPQLKP
jgi:hypothetical protein